MSATTANDNEEQQNRTHEAIEPLEAALLDLAHSRDDALAARLTRLFTAVAAEASKTPRFANALARALQEKTPQIHEAAKPRRGSRRNPGPFDPFEVYADSQEAGLRERLSSLDLEQLRDVVAQHGMDNDRLAMKWKDPLRVIDRIVDRVSSRTAKGSAFK